MGYKVLVFCIGKTRDGRPWPGPAFFGTPGLALSGPRFRREPPGEGPTLAVGQGLDGTEGEGQGLAEEDLGNGVDDEVEIEDVFHLLT